MARPKEFVPEDALRAAMERFWERGFEATSLAELTECTGVQKTSLYATFGDKRSLFMQALARYQDDGYERLSARLDVEGSALDALRGFFGDVVKQASSESGHKGCLCVNTAIELAPHDEEIAELSRRYSLRIEQLFERTLARAVEQSELDSAFDTAATARFLVATLYGLSVVAKTSPSSKRLKDIVAVALSVIAS